MGPVQVANLALLEMGSRVGLSSFNDGTPQSNAAAQFYTPKMQALLRAANWGFARRQVLLTQLQALFINGQLSANPPPTPFGFTYAYPPDCMRARFLLPPPYPNQATTPPLTTAPSQVPFPTRPNTKIPFVESTILDNNGNSIRVLLSSLSAATLVYTTDLTQIPDLWDPLFLSAATAVLAAYFINSLARNAQQMQEQIGLAKNALDQARSINASEQIGTADQSVSWIRVREASAIGWGNGYGQSSNGGPPLCEFDPMQMPNGLWY